MVTVPPESVPPLFPPPTVVGATTDTSPVGVPVAGAVTATLTFAVTAVPCVIAAGVALLLINSVDVVPLKLPRASGHCVARLATFTEPRPVARS